MLLHFGGRPGKGERSALRDEITRSPAEADDHALAGRELDQSLVIDCLEETAIARRNREGFDLEVAR